MKVPDHRDVPQKLFDTGLYDLKSHDGQGAFVDAVVSTLHTIDEAWCHLRKKPGQTAIHGHAEDAALYLFPDGTAQAVDFIGGAAGPNPKPGWGVDSHIYKHTDGLDPKTHGTGTAPAPQPPPPSYGYPDENTAGKDFQRRAKQAYTDAGRKFPDPNDEDQFRHFMRYGYSSHEMPEQKAADKHIAELRKDLGV